MKLQDYLDKNYTKEKQIALTHLDCSYENITSLEGIELLINLNTLFCYENYLTSLKGIENLTNLTHLNCSYNLLTSLKGVENLKSLYYIDCANNPLPYKSTNTTDLLKEVKSEVRKEKISKLLL